MMLSRQQLRSQLRLHLRSSRRALSTAQQHLAAKKLAQHFARLAHLTSWRHVALYWPDDGEIDPSLFARTLQARGVRVYLPIIAARKSDYRLRFRAAPTMAYRPLHRSHLHHQPWPAKRNRFGLREPLTRGYKQPEALDALLMPLVGFDAQGQRLGMGGGFYDRLLAQLRGRVKRPQLIGLAHQCQEVLTVPTASWDESVDVIVTDTKIQRMKKQSD